MQQHRVSDEYFGGTGLIRGPSRNPFGELPGYAQNVFANANTLQDSIAAEKTYQEAAQKRAAAQENDRLQALISLYSTATSQASPSETTAAREDTGSQDPGPQPGLRNATTAREYTRSSDYRPHSTDVRQSSSTLRAHSSLQIGEGSVSLSSPLDWSAWTWSDDHQKYWSGRNRSDGTSLAFPKLEGCA